MIKKILLVLLAAIIGAASYSEVDESAVSAPVISLLESEIADMDLQEAKEYIVKRLPPPDLTSEIEALGQPFDLPVYARNIWDMYAYGDRIYLGCGNSSNKGPNANAGPVPVVYYDTGKNEFVTQTVIGEEQIDIYRVIDGKLVIPGHDSKESWSYGNFYVLHDDTWEKYRTIPDGIHVYDMAFYNGYLFAATGTAGFGTALMSGDMGKTWISLTPQDAQKFYTEGLRAYSVFEFKDKLYFTGTLYNGFSYYNNFLCVDKSADLESAAKGAVHGAKTGISIIRVNMLPGAEKEKTMRMVRINEINDKLVYLVAYADNDHQWIPDALYVAKEINRSKRVELPEPDAKPMDIIVRDNMAYLLAYKQIKDENAESDGSQKYEGGYINLVYSSEDMYTWTEYFRFSADTFARSFEEHDDAFYFGLGCHADNLAKSTGNVLRIIVEENRSIEKVNSTL